ncbi:MAG: aspartate aminotransferase family protein [Immundisolibacteraceae bacterium]|nr:aspartate aminotransferase family protein [Immundisolibacteraceae bacterium]
MMANSVKNTLMPTYARLPVSFVKGEGVWLIDDAGRRYLDGVAGISVCNLGHAHPKIAAVIADQASQLLHTSNLYQIPLQQALADQLCQLSGMDQVFFGNSGAEANEAAIKLARLHGHAKGIENPLIIVAEHSFHGRTMATLSATGNRKVHVGFEPLVSGFVRVPFDDVDGIQRVAELNPDVVAILVEPVQGEGGVNVPGADYLTSIRQICDQHGWLMMLDEIQSGMGRCGSWFAFQRTGENSATMPDVMTVAKALANGVPIGACLVSGAATGLMQAGHHGSTFGGNPLACRAALETLSIMKAEDIPGQVAIKGKQFRQLLTDKLQGCDGVVEVRGAGLLVGVELDRPCGELVARALERGLLINVAAGNIIRLIPALIITTEQLAELADGVAQLVLEFVADDGATQE